MRENRPIKVTVIRYVDDAGRRCAKSAPGAKAVREESETYYGWIGRGEARRRHSLGTTDLGQAWIGLRRLQRDEANRERGVTDEFSEHAGRPLVEHVGGWLASVAAKGTSAKQISLLRKSVIKLAELAHWDRLPQVSADSCTRALALLAEHRTKRHPHGCGAQTRNHYLSHAKQFLRWCIEDGRISRNPLLAVKPVNVQADRRHDRRSPADEEIGRLYEYLYGPAAVARNEMTGPGRALLYKIGMATGFRALELRSLARESFDLDAGVATVRAAYDKRRRPVTQQLPAWLVEELREWFDGGGACWQALHAVHPGRVLKADLEAAGVPYATPGPDGPLYFDMHSLRVWYCTQIANQPGISPKTMMTLCRHSTAQLTLKTYAKSRDADLRDAVAKLPPPPAQTTPPPPPE